MKLIAVISHKGGAGKTTSAVQLAEELARRGQRTLLVDADRQQGAGLLLGIDAPAGCVQRTMMGDLSYLGSARLTDLEIADCYASVANRFDVGVVDTPSLDDALARAWLREAAAALMVLQVDPLTVKTLPSALNTLEVVRAFKPSIQILGLLPTMFDQHEEAHSRLLAELLSRKPEAVFTPVVPMDSGLMHRANTEEAPPLGEAARQAYQCAVDRILRALETAEPSVALPHNTQRVTPPWAQVPVQRPAAMNAPAPPPAQVQPPAPAPARAVEPPAGNGYTVSPPDVPAAYEVAPTTTPAGGYASAPPAVSAKAGMPPGGFPSAQTAGAAAQSGGLHAAEPAPADALAWDDEPEQALETLAASRVEPKQRPRKGRESMPDWYRQGRVDAAGVARRQESWLIRSRFAIACTVACLALIAAVVLGTLRRVPVAGDQPMGGAVAPAVAATPHTKVSEEGGSEAGNSQKTKPRKKAAHKAATGSGESSRSGKSKGD
jgi:chromosome partitioning protein